MLFLPVQSTFLSPDLLFQRFFSLPQHWFAAVVVWDPEVRTVCGSGSRILRVGPSVLTAAVPSGDRTSMMLLVLMDVGGKEPGETTISLACPSLPAPRCPRRCTGGCGGVCAICTRGPLCTWNSTLHLGSSWVPHCNRKVSLLCYSYYLFVPFSTTVTVSPSSYYMHQVFRLPPFPQTWFHQALTLCLWSKTLCVISPFWLVVDIPPGSVTSKNYIYVVSPYFSWS